MIAMILAAGLGSRLKPWTDFHPKALAMVNGKSVLQRNIEYLQAAGITDVVVNVHHFASQIIEAVEMNAGWGSQIAISDESDEVLETGGGVKKAIPLFGEEENVLVMNADILTDLSLTDFIFRHEASGAEATLAVSDRNSSRCFLFDENEKLCGWRNKSTGETKLPSPADHITEFAFSGVHIINQSIFRNMPFNGKFSMVDVYLAMCANHPIIAYNHSGAKFIDIGTMEKLEKASAMFP